jgi:general secretion pathway protein G
MMLAANRRRTARRAAFTLLEVLVVVAILVILAGVGVVATTRYLEDARKSRAQMACSSIAQAIEAYKINPANTEQTMPSSIQDLNTPPFGGTGFLKNGEADIIDPWNNYYQFAEIQQNDGSMIVLVYTYAQDGSNTPISQYGIGRPACGQVP